MKNPLSYPARAVAYAIAVASIGDLEPRLWTFVVITIVVGVAIEILMGYMGLN